MTIKEFSHKHSLVFFWATVVLAVLLILTAVAGENQGRRGEMMRGGYDREGGRMMNRQGGNYNNGNQRQMMDPNNPNQPLINDTPGAQMNASGTVNVPANQ